MKKKQRQFTVEVAYFEGRTHSIVETWKCAGQNALKKTLAHALDLFTDENGGPAEPNRAELEKRLARYADADFIDGEYRRLLKAYRIYSKFSAECAGGAAERASAKIDSRTTIAVERRG